MRFARPAIIAIAAVLGFGVCTSQPSVKAVAQDYIESIPDLTEDQRQCMLGELDKYDSDTLTSIGNANLDVDFDQPSDTAVDSGTPEFQAFVEDLNGCMSGSG